MLAGIHFLFCWKPHGHLCPPQPSHKEHSFSQCCESHHLSFHFLLLILLCTPPHTHTLPSVFCKYLRPFLGLLFDDVCSLAGCRCKHIFTNVRHLFLQPLRRQTRPVMSGSVTCRLRRVEFCFVSQLLWADEHCYFFRGFTQNTHSGSLHQLLSRLWCLQLL